MTDAKLVITRYQEGVLSFVINNNRMESVAFSRQSERGSIGDIYVAKVVNVVPHLNAAFIDYMPGKKGFLPLDKYVPVLTNREYNGKLVAGDEVLVQLEKEAVRTKEPVFTLNLSLAGNYCVVTNADTKKGISNKVAKKWKDALFEAVPKDIPYGIVVRTNAGRLAEENQLQAFADECKLLSDEMKQLLQNSRHRTCYSCVRKAASEYLAQVCDNSHAEFSEIVTDDEDLFAELKAYLAANMPQYLSMLRLYTDVSYSMQKLYGVETKLGELLDKRVWMKSGAYLVIEQTEAMYVVDVNSGKNISGKENEEYIYKINLEAATETMRQIRLRNLSGIIIVDFLNMKSQEKQEALLRELRELAGQDKIYTNVVDMTPLGLVEITRKKTKPILAQQLKAF
ncbi:MAG: ribonuclease E/G [Lachnospiraceae bacterium]|nr:ribonuclease E/G [Lachnospiraceae bacterium]